MEAAEYQCDAMIFVVKVDDPDSIQYFLKAVHTVSGADANALSCRARSAVHAPSLAAWCLLVGPCRCLTTCRAS